MRPRLCCWRKLLCPKGGGPYHSHDGGAIVRRADDSWHGTCFNRHQKLMIAAVIENGEIGPNRKPARRPPKPHGCRKAAVSALYYASIQKSEISRFTFLRVAQEWEKQRLWHSKLSTVATWPAG